MNYDYEVRQEMNYEVWGNVTQDTNPGFQPFGSAMARILNSQELVRETTTLRQGDGQ